MTYAEFLKSQGASDDEIKILDVLVARKAYEQSVAAQQKAEQKYTANVEWAQTVEAQNQQYLRERDTALATAEAEKARVKKLSELGLLQVAENLEPGSTTPKPGETSAFDPKLLDRYVTSDTLMQVAEREGDAIAIAQDISFEHQQLFGGDPTRRLNFRELRREAVARKMPVESLWMEKYGVQSARDAAAAKSQREREDRIAAEAVTKYKSEHPETNPMLATPTISKTPFTGKVISAGEKGVQPWNRPDAEKENARVLKAIASVEKLSAVN